MNANRGNNQTDLTSESAFHNLTNEELHISMSKYNAENESANSSVGEANYNSKD